MGQGFQDTLARVAMIAQPTPLERLARLSAHLGGPDIYVKRDDCTGVGLGGNKIRKLEYLLADALAQEADTLVTVGGLQTNHGRQTAAVAARAGLACHLVLTQGAYADDAQFHSNGNLLLDRLFGATLHVIPPEVDRLAAMAALAQTLRDAGRRPYVVASGGSCPVGAQGYRRAAHELVAQAREQDVDPAALVVCCGSGGTQAGLLLGLAEAGASWVVQGISSAKSTAEGAADVARLAREGARLAGLADLPLGAVLVDDDHVGQAYGVPTPEALAAIDLCARLEGLVLDPVYTGKAMAGLIAGVRAGRWQAGQKLVFLHTGGAPALFAYRHFSPPVAGVAA